MKKIMMLFAALMMCGFLWSQEVFTVVYATSDDGFVNVRQRPSAKSKKIAQIWMLSHGLGQGVWRGQQGNWVKVSVGKVTGWCNGKYIGTQNWYSGKGEQVLVANKNSTTIYVEGYGDNPYEFYTTVPRGTIIADEFEENETHYILLTAHDALFICKTDAIVRKK